MMPVDLSAIRALVAQSRSITEAQLVKAIDEHLAERDKLAAEQANLARFQAGVELDLAALQEAITWAEADVHQAELKVGSLVTQLSCADELLNLMTEEEEEEPPPPPP